MDFETLVKVIVVGNGGVGKSSMSARYCKGVFTSTYKKTIGVDYLEKSIDTESGETVKLMVWDTAGQEEFDALTAGYYRGAGACVLVFSTTDRASFEAIEKWKRKVEENSGRIVMALVQNKTDLMGQAVMTDSEVNSLAARLKLPLFRACVKDNINVAEVFEYLAGQYILKGGDVSGVGAVAAIGDYGATAGTASVHSSAAEQLSETKPDSDVKFHAKSPEEKIAADEEDAPDSFPAVVAPSGSASAAADKSGLPPPPTSGTFKLTAEPKIKPKKAFSWC